MVHDYTVWKPTGTGLPFASVIVTVPVKALPSLSVKLPVAKTVPAGARSENDTAAGQPDQMGGPSAGNGGAIVTVKASGVVNLPSAVTALAVHTALATSSAGVNARVKKNCCVTLASVWAVYSRTIAEASGQQSG